MQKKSILFVKEKNFGESLLDARFRSVNHREKTPETRISMDPLRGRLSMPPFLSSLLGAKHDLKWDVQCSFSDAQDPWAHNEDDKINCAEKNGII